MDASNKVIPDFMIIGAMKCATSTLHEQLAALPNTSMSNPKEPCFFSDDDIYKKGDNWYASLFDCTPNTLIGESSTHYTKFPTYPHTIDRMLKYGVQDTKFIYIMREPIERLVSHYIHEWSQGVIKKDINLAIEHHPELIDYSRYFYQISHYMKHFSKNQIMLIFFENLRANPQKEFKRVCNFIGIEGNPQWNSDIKPMNVSAQRLKKIPFHSLLVDSSLMTSLRRGLIPKSLRNKVKDNLRMKNRPELSKNSTTHLRDLFDEDLKELGGLIGAPLSIESYRDIASSIAPTIQPGDF